MRFFFTSGGTESDNMAIWSAIEDLGCKHLITSPIEHHAVLHTVNALAKQRQLTSQLLRVLPNGHIDLADLERALATSSVRCFVSLMHANNEIGNLLDIEAVGFYVKSIMLFFTLILFKQLGTTR